MSNPLYQQFLMQNSPLNMTADFFQRLQQFRQNFQGNPQEIVHNMLKSGQISQQQYDMAVMQANKICGR